MYSVQIRSYEYLLDRLIDFNLELPSVETNFRKVANDLVNEFKITISEAYMIISNELMKRRD